MSETRLDDMPKKEATRINPAFIRSTCVTLLLILVFRIGLYMQVPFLNQDALNEFFGPQNHFGSKTLERISIFCLGLMPYVSAYILVEIFSLFLPGLKKLRNGRYSDRVKLKRIGLFVTLILAIFQSIGIVDGLLEIRNPGGESILDIESNYEYALIVVSLVAGVYILIFICELISKYGIGHGISMIMMAGICINVYFGFANSSFWKYEFGPLVYAAVVAAIGLLVWLTVLLLTTKTSVETSHDADNKSYRFFQYNFCPSGFVPITYAASLVMIPVTISYYADSWQGVAEALNYGSLYYEISMVVCTLFLSCLFAWLFFHPGRRLEKMHSSGWRFQTGEDAEEKFLLKKMLIYSLPWTGFLCLLAIIPHLLISGLNIPFYIGGTTVPIIVAISLDVLDRYKFSNLHPGHFSKIAEFHDVYEATMIKNHLTAEGILCYMQGYYHRHLLFFFGPHIEISLMVAHEDQTVAKDIISNYYNGLGLF